MTTLMNEFVSSAEYKPDYALAKELAENELKECRITTAPVPVSDVAERLEFDIIGVAFPSSVARYSGYIDLDLMRIVVNSTEPFFRQRFTVAHAIGHYVLHRDRFATMPDLKIIMRGADNNSFETEANIFATTLLMPSYLLRQYKDSSIESIAKIFNVSELMVRKQLGYNNIVDFFFYG